MPYPTVKLDGLTTAELDQVAHQLGAGVPEARVAEYVKARQRAHLLEAAGLSPADLPRESVTV